MDYSKDITDILDDYISSMIYLPVINSITDLGGGLQQLNCCDIFYAHKGLIIELTYTNGVGGQKDYTIVDFNQANETITINTTDVISLTATDNKLRHPHFFHGTPVATDVELGQTTDAGRKTPMIWLWENFKEKSLIDIDPIGRKIDVELYFLTQPPIEIQLMQTEDSYIEMIQPMKRLLELFIASISKPNNTFDMDFDFEYSTENYAKFGVMARNKGADKKILFDNLSGVSLKITLRLWDKFSCKIC